MTLDNTPSALVAAATAGTGLAHYLDLFNGVLSTITMIAGLVLTIVLIRKHWSK